MQSLLCAVGVGASAALPMAATLNWVIKDGLGQLGGVIFARYSYTRPSQRSKQRVRLAHACFALLLPAHVWCGSIVHRPSLSVVSNQFDADPKRWRMAAALSMDAGTVPYPGHTLPRQSTPT
jgi:hypothetical protein